MKQVIWRKKSSKRAIPAYSAKALTAGIVDNEPANNRNCRPMYGDVSCTVGSLPRKKQQTSESDDTNMDGATSPTMRPMCSSWDSPRLRGSRWYVWTKMKMLSTPTANTKKGITFNYKSVNECEYDFLKAGITSMIINVAGTPNNP